MITYWPRIQDIESLLKIIYKTSIKIQSANIGIDDKEFLTILLFNKFEFNIRTYFNQFRIKYITNKNERNENPTCTECNKIHGGLTPQFIMLFEKVDNKFSDLFSLIKNQETE